MERTVKRIEEMFVYVAEDSEGEGIAAFGPVEGMMIPLVGADVARSESIRAVAQFVADTSGRTLKILRFTTREQIGVIEPKRRGN